MKLSDNALVNERLVRLEEEREAAELQFAKLQSEVAKIKEKEMLAMQRFHTAKAKGQKNRTSKTSAKLREKVQHWQLKRKEASAALKEARTLCKELSQLIKYEEKKYRALRKELVAFIKEWERKYEGKTKLRRHNASIRKQWADRDNKAQK